MNIELEDTHISISHRLPSKLKQTNTSDQNIKPPPIIVKFTSQKKRNEIYYKRKNIPQISDFEIPQIKELYINENLTNVRKSLLYEARKLKKIQGYNFVWTHMGDILARKNEKAKVLKICTLADLKKCVNDCDLIFFYFFFNTIIIIIIFFFLFLFFLLAYTYMYINYLFKWLHNTTR